MASTHDDHEPSPSGYLDAEPTPLKSNFVLDLPPVKNKAGLRSSLSSDNDTASQRSISLSSASGSPATKSINLDDDSHDDIRPRPVSFYAQTTPDPVSDLTTSHTMTSPHSPLDLIRDSLGLTSPYTPQSSILSSNSTRTITEDNSSRDSTAYPLSLSSDMSSEIDDDRSLFMKRFGDEDGEEESPVTSLAPSLADKTDNKPLTLTSTSSPPPVPPVPPLPSIPPPVPKDEEKPAAPLPLSLSSTTTTLVTSPPLPPSSPTATYPPKPVQELTSDRQSVASFATGSSGATTYSKKARPESLLVQMPEGRLVLGIALVDFNHLVCSSIIFQIHFICQSLETYPAYVNTPTLWVLYASCGRKVNVEEY